MTCFFVGGFGTLAIGIDGFLSGRGHGEIRIYGIFDLLLVDSGALIGQTHFMLK